MGVKKFTVKSVKPNWFGYHKAQRLYSSVSHGITKKHTKAQLHGMMKFSIINLMIS